RIRVGVDGPSRPPHRPPDGAGRPRLHRGAGGPSTRLARRRSGGGGPAARGQRAVLGAAHAGRRPHLRRALPAGVGAPVGPVLGGGPGREHRPPGGRAAPRLTGVSVDFAGARRYHAAYTRALIDLAIVAMIPARFGSTRLPGKPLSDIHGKPMIQHVHERVRRARRPDRVLVCTDDDRIAAVVRGFSGEGGMTSRDAATGTDRLAEAARGTAAEIVVNVQGDEPLVDPDGIDAAVDGLERDPGLDMATLSLPLRDVEEMLSPSVVKVVCDAKGDALYFSRSPLPLVRQGASSDLRAAAAAAV